MVSDLRCVDYILDQTAVAGGVTARKMFGEYAVYCDGKLVALICDDSLFVKPTPGGRSHLGLAIEASPYPGAKPCFVVPAEFWDDADWLSRLIRITAAELPPAKTKKRR